MEYNIHLTYPEAVMLSKLLREMEDKSLSNIIRRTLFSKGKGLVRDIVKDERPDFNDAKLDQLERPER